MFCSDEVERKEALKNRSMSWPSFTFPTELFEKRRLRIRVVVWLRLTPGHQGETRKIVCRI